MTDKALERCPTCRGTKTLLSMGGMYKSCEACKGIGYIEPVTLSQVIDDMDYKLSKEMQNQVDKQDDNVVPKVIVKKQRKPRSPFKYQLA